LRCDWPCPEGKGQTFESRAFAQQLQATEALLPVDGMVTARGPRLGDEHAVARYAFS